MKNMINSKTGEDTMKNKYSSIENFKSVNKTVLLWSIEEKIHGQNMSFLVTKSLEGEIKIESRTRNTVISSDQSKIEFEDNTLIDKNVIKVILSIIETISSRNLRFSELTIYGELFGGYFNGEKSDRNIIQHGVEYSKEHNFIPFDIIVDELPINIKKFFKDSIKTVPVFKENLTYDEVKDFIKDNLESQESAVCDLYSLKCDKPNKVEGFIIRNNFGEKFKVVSNNFKEVKGSSDVKVKDLQTKSGFNEKIKDLVNFKLLIDKTVAKYHKIDGNFTNIITDIYEDIRQEIKITEDEELKMLKSLVGKEFSNFYKKTK